MVVSCRNRIVFMVKVTQEVIDVRIKLYEAIKLSDRSVVSLIRDGFSRSHVQLGMPVLIKQGLIYKFGAGKATYYSVNPHAHKMAYVRKIDPIVIPEVLQDNFALAFRMGYTDILPDSGRTYKGLMHG